MLREKGFFQSSEAHKDKNIWPLSALYLPFIQGKGILIPL
jgi:hypothetical protein